MDKSNSSISTVVPGEDPNATIQPYIAQILLSSDHITKLDNLTREM